MWNLAATQGAIQPHTPLAADAKARVQGPWINVKSGDTLDFILRAPKGDDFAGVAWNLRIEGCESADDKPEEISDLNRSFPTTDAPPPAPRAASPWADLVQMLWASNEFHFID